VNKEQVFEVLQLIGHSYYNFEVTQEKIDTWHKLLKDQNAAVIMRNAERYVLENKFPPTVADIRERLHEAYSSKILEQIREWECNASRK
jgi:hypothetical protein